MKQPNVKVAITGLTISACLLAGSAFAFAKVGNWHSDLLQSQQTALKASESKLRVNAAGEKQFAVQENNPLLSKILPQLSFMSAQISPPLNNEFFKGTKINTAIDNGKVISSAVQVKPEAKVQVKPKAVVQAKAPVQVKPKAAVKAKKAVPSKSLKQAITNTSLKFETTKKVTAARKAAAVSESHSLEISPGNTIEYSRLVPVKATAYTAAAEENGPWGAFDFFGNPLKLGTIAVDPEVIPMGSTVYITGYSFNGLPVKGMLAKANDQGSSIQGKRVDIFIPTSRADASEFGMQDVKVYIVK
jgi:3D (Asp-Asp-Asp) domain-containing protein